VRVVVPVLVFFSAIISLLAEAIHTFRDMHLYKTISTRHASSFPAIADLCPG